MKDFYHKVSFLLAEIIKEEFSAEIPRPLWEIPPQQEFGDLSSMAALKLASKLKRDPLEIARRLKVRLEKALTADVDKIDILKPGFVNIFIASPALINSLNELIKNKDKFFRRAVKKKIILEYVSANPTGPLSIAHGRQAVVGDIIGNILEFFGNTVTREYYVNDEGRQMELLVASVEAWLPPHKGENVPEDGYRGEYVRDIAAAVAQNERWQKDPAKFDLRKFVLNYLLVLIKKDLALLGVKFNRWVSQREFIQSKKVAAAVDSLKKKGLIYEQEGALWFASTKFGDDKDRVIKKADGELTYFASDIAYHKDKLSRRAQVLINLWGPDHHGYVGRVKAAIKAQGFREDILKVIIIQLVNIKTKGRMSRRKGNVVLLSDLVEEVGKDAARFYYLLRKNSSHLEFDIDLAQQASFDNPLYYVQYACARIESIFRKAQVSIPRRPQTTQFLQQKEEIDFIRFLLQFSYCLEKAYYSLEPVVIIEYLRSLAAVVHKFYETKRVLVENKDTTAARLNLLGAAKIVLHCGLRLLGIKPVSQM